MTPFPLFAFSRLVQFTDPDGHARAVICCEIY